MVVDEGVNEPEKVVLDLDGRRDHEVENWMLGLERSISCRIPEGIVLIGISRQTILTYLICARQTSIRPLYAHNY